MADEPHAGGPGGFGRLKDAGSRNTVTPLSGTPKRIAFRSGARSGTNGFFKHRFGRSAPLAVTTVGVSNRIFTMSNAGRPARQRRACGMGARQWARLSGTGGITGPGPDSEAVP